MKVFILIKTVYIRHETPDVSIIGVFHSNESAIKYRQENNLKDEIINHVSYYLTIEEYTVQE